MEEQTFQRPKRLEIYLAELHKQSGSVQYGYRPVIIIQNDIGNRNAPTVIVVPLTSKVKKTMPTHVVLKTDTGINLCSTALCEQIQTIDMRQLSRCVGVVDDPEDIEALHKAIKISLGLE